MKLAWLCPICGESVQATVKVYLDHTADRGWKFTGSVDGSLYCVNDHQLEDSTFVEPEDGRIVVAEVEEIVKHAMFIEVPS